MAKGSPIPLELANSVHRKLLRVADRHRLTPQRAATRAIEWLVNQPELIQAAVLGKFAAPIDQELARHILRPITRDA